MSETWHWYVRTWTWMHTWWFHHPVAAVIVTVAWVLVVLTALRIYNWLDER